ncbi:phospholipid/cholesterol/gamma-HCH transport system ATP-binding protein [Natronocella acetinitrilica]|uniref:Phospholipid/cholesterol/gamma-HCH transport system ATP-binding protein n=1 Tax=Natronocella acetinitrilica TaxID=414046 RepID=A0AAE3G168_9GAMM|nr:ABC transporter ATP-binding protein [Natronocella acetinitrilica]MCP1673885.1 phospholipid/cholesterol/gamma-HCH transport system ATP-binding protein [Natronocella acetinitrilica]
MASPADDILIDVRDLHFRRGDRVIFDGVDLQIRRGEVSAIMGPSGTGKTTLLRLIGGQLKPDQGTIHVEGQNVHTMSLRELYAMRRRMGMLFQSGALFTHLTVFENVAFPLREHTRLPEPVLRDLVLMKLEAVGLRGARDLMPGELSGGMARRVALARAVVLDPTMIMYDEPFAGQDPITMGTLVSLIRLINDTLKLSSIIVSHDVAETSQIADRIFVLSEGRVVESGSPEELAQSESAWVRQFFNALPDGPVPFHYPAPGLGDDLLGPRR